jgi:hypothetical protein
MRGDDLATLWKVPSTGPGLTAPCRHLQYRWVLLDCPYSALRAMRNPTLLSAELGQ